MAFRIHEKGNGVYMGFRQELERSLPCDERAPYLARRSLLLLDPGLSDECYETVALLVTELVTNSVRHSGMPPDETIGLKIEADEQHLRAAVTDGGTCEIRSAAEPAELDTRGRGLFLVDVLADRWGVECSPTNTVWFELAGRAG